MSAKSAAKRTSVGLLYVPSAGHQPGGVVGFAEKSPVHAMMVPTGTDDWRAR
jgi:hypothetical protein